MLEWLTAWEDRVPLALMPRLMTVEVDVIIERKKDNAGILFEERDVRRNGYDIITQIRRLISRFIHSTYTFCFDLKKKLIYPHVYDFLIK